VYEHRRDTEDRRVFRGTHLLPHLELRHPSSQVADPVPLTTNREIANAIFGARNARGGERQFATGRGIAESNLHLFEPVQLLSAVIG
jgi:hypothetical protein